MSAADAPLPPAVVPADADAVAAAEDHYRTLVARWRAEDRAWRGLAPAEHERAGGER